MKYDAVLGVFFSHPGSFISCSNFLSISLFPDILYIVPYFRMRNTISNTYKATGKFKVLQSLHIQIVIVNIRNFEKSKRLKGKAITVSGRGST
jgi:hypothetical protein